MAQRPTSDFDIDPNITSGTDLANILNRFQDAMDSGNSGPSRPAYLAAGGMWVKEGDPMRLYLYDGSKDIELYNTTDGIVGAIEDGTVDGQVTTWSASASEWMPNDAVIVKGGNVGIGTDNPAGGANRVVDVYGSSSSAVNFHNDTTGNTATGGSVVGQYGKHLTLFNYEAGDIQFGTSNTEAMIIDASGRVGIGGEPGTRTIDEAKALAKTKLTAWKAELKKRTAEQPEASTQEITLEVTDGDFGVMPTEQALAEFLQEPNIGGGDAKLQVLGDGYFSGDVYSNGSPLTRATDLIETLSTLREATRDETTLEGLRDALSDAIGGLIQKFEAQTSTMDD